MWHLHIKSGISTRKTWCNFKHFSCCTISIISWRGSLAYIEWHDSISKLSVPFYVKQDWKLVFLHLCIQSVFVHQECVFNLICIVPGQKGIIVCVSHLWVLSNWICAFFSNFRSLSKSFCTVIVIYHLECWITMSVCCSLGKGRHFAFGVYFFSIRLSWLGWVFPLYDDWVRMTVYFFFSIKIHDLSDLREMYAIINLDDENKGMLTVSMRIEIFTN